MFLLQATSVRPPVYRDNEIQAKFHAASASTKPQPVAKSTPTAALLLALAPFWISLALNVSAYLIAAGVNVGRFCRSNAAIPATCGVANEVPVPAFHALTRTAGEV